MMRVWVVIWLWLSAVCAAAQTYIQVEAHPSLAEGVEAAERYQRLTGAASGFELGGSWYAVVLGPYEPARADVQLRLLRRTGRIPRDSYLTTIENYGPRFYPGASAAPTETVAVPAPLDPYEAAPDALADRESGLPDQTPAEARRAERLLTAQDRALVQTALADAGVYSGVIDAAYGPGTRRAMADWQAANGFRPTGILTTAQKATLIGAYNAILDGLQMTRVTEAKAGIEIDLPTALIVRESEETPFVRYGPAGDLSVRVLLISQKGDRKALAGLYELMQMLEIVPADGPRVRRPTSFEIEGRNGEVVSTTWAELVRDEIKGYTLVWPTGDERRRTRVLDKMRASFNRLPGVLPAPAVNDAPAPDLLAGFKIRRPQRDRSGFYVDGSGTVLTTHEAVRTCERVTLDETVEAEVAATDEELGLALLRPTSRLPPARYAHFRTTPPPPRSEVAVAGYPFGAALPVPSLNFGTLADAEWRDGNAARARLALGSEPGETGGPVLDDEGAVIGILLPRGDGAPRLPDDVSLAIAAGQVTDFLAAAGLSAGVSAGGDEVAPEELTRLAADMTVLVSCWN